MVDKGWAVAYDSPESLARALGTDDFPVNRLALISKTKPDGSAKHRLIRDLCRSQVNALVRQGERVVLPRLQDAVADALDLLEALGEGVVFLGTDVSDAFHQVPISPEEYPFTAAVIDGRYYHFKILVFGAASAPT
eukprot:10126932-Alexandrium_andersonii.AAC.1